MSSDSSVPAYARIADWRHVLTLCFQVFGHILLGDNPGQDFDLVGTDGIQTLNAAGAKEITAIGKDAAFQCPL